MTCILSWVEDGVVWMGGDAAGVTDMCNVRPVAHPKVFIVDQFLIGYAHSFRLGQILQHHLHPREQDQFENDHAYMVRGFIEHVRDLFKRLGYPSTSSNDGSSAECGWEFLVGYKGHIYSVQDDFQATEGSDQFNAIGCGADIGLGALLALRDLDPKERILRALEVTAHLCAYVRPPYTVLTLDEHGQKVVM